MIRNIERKIIDGIYSKYNQLKESQSDEKNECLYYVIDDILYLPCLIRNNAAYYIITEKETVYKKSFNKDEENDEEYNPGLAIIDLSNLEIVRLYRPFFQVSKFLNPVSLSVSLNTSTNKFVDLIAGYHIRFFLFTDDHSVIFYLGEHFDYNGEYILGLYDSDDYYGAPELIDVKTKKRYNFEKELNHLDLDVENCIGKLIGDKVLFWDYQRTKKLTVPVQNIIKNDFWGMASSYNPYHVSSDYTSDEETSNWTKLETIDISVPETENNSYYRKPLYDKVKDMVDTWEILPNGIRCKSLFDYIPVNTQFHVSDSDWKVRRLIWNFKNDHDAILDKANEDAVNEIISRLRNIIKDEWIEDGLELVCIPASTEMLSQRRFSKFLQKFYYIDLCGDFEYNFHIHVIKEASPKHLGGTGYPLLSFDQGYFDNKIVILFDDIVTTGNSLLRMKHMLEDLGAYVAGAITIGRTVTRNG